MVKIPTALSMVEGASCRALQAFVLDGVGDCAETKGRWEGSCRKTMPVELGLLKWGK